MDYLQIIKMFGIWGLLTAILLTICLLIAKLFVNTLFAKDLKKFEELHSKRLKIIDETYKKVVAVEKAILMLVSYAKEYMPGDPPASEEDRKNRQQKKLDDFSTIMIKFMNYIDYHQLYYNKPIVKILKEFRSYCLNNSIHFMFRKASGELDITFEERQKLHDEMLKKFPSLKNELEKLFKKIIGE